MDNVRTDAKTLRECLFAYFTTDKFFNNNTHIGSDEYSFVITTIINGVVNTIKNANFKTIEKFLFVEDGSIDVDELDSLAITNPEIKVIIVRQGGRIPELKEAK